MSARLDSVEAFRPMRPTDLDRVMAIEPTLYSHPWTRGNFEDSINAGYVCRVIECEGVIAGYGVLMIGAGEAHLLNLSVESGWQRRGLGRALLEHFVRAARDGAARQMLLEVRPSNVLARRLYADFGFSDLSLRRDYYPADRGREDAILMSLPL